jgi:hypothetical protein
VYEHSICSAAALKLSQTQVFYTLRLKKAKALVLATKKVERNGGMMTADGQRRRTAGGTFFCLLKDAVSPDIFKSICAHDARYGENCYSLWIKM